MEKNLTKGKSEMSQNNYFPTQYQQYIYLSRYSRWLPEKNRRETWVETVKRYFDFFQEHLKENHKHDITPYRARLEEAVLSLRAMPSMRCIMTAGEALKRENIAGYNCSYTAVNRPRVFDEILYILMNGTGVGFSVEVKDVSQLPIVPEEFHETDTTIVVADSKLGWAKALKELISMLYVGQKPRWDVSKVRPAGSPLKTFGGRASGPEPLVDLFQFCVDTFGKAAGRKLTTVECHDIVCKIADIVVVGGVRRSALISLSDLNDDRMRNAKSGQWWIEDGHRRLANNSAVYNEKPDIGIFMDEWKALYDSKSGERGIFNRQAAQKNVEKIGRRDHKQSFGANPCGEIILRDMEFCNLTEAIIRGTDTEKDLAEKVEIAAILGTWQSTLTNFKYLSKKWKENCEEERLLGVSLTGIMDSELTNNKKSGLSDRLDKWTKVAQQINEEYAKKIGIPPSVAITTVKPSGCVTLDTKIRTTDGIKTLQNIFDENGVDLINVDSGSWFIPSRDLMVYDQNNHQQKVSKLYVNGITEIYEIEDEEGNVFKFTGNHKVMVGGVWKRVDELKETDSIDCW